MAFGAMFLALKGAVAPIQVTRWFVPGSSSASALLVTRGKCFLAFSLRAEPANRPRGVAPLNPDRLACQLWTEPLLQVEEEKLEGRKALVGGTLFGPLLWYRRFFDKRKDELVTGERDSEDLTEMVEILGLSQKQVRM